MGFFMFDDFYKYMMSRILIAILTLFSFWFVVSCENPNEGLMKRVGASYCIKDSTFSKETGTEKDKRFFNRFLRTHENSHFWHATLTSSQLSYYVSVFQSDKGGVVNERIKDRFSEVYKVEQDDFGRYFFGRRDTLYLSTTLVYDPTVHDFLVFDYLNSDSGEVNQIYFNHRITKFVKRCTK